MSVRLVIQRTSDTEVNELATFWNKVCHDSNHRTAHELVQLDQEFHLRLAALSQNAELRGTLKHINERIHYIRWVALENQKRRDATYDEHYTILAALKRRDVDAAEQLMHTHVTRRLEQIIEVVKDSIARLYVN